jgi:predicted amino acid racemase
MFLQRIVDRNPALAEVAVGLHQSGVIPPNTWVIDLEAVAENGAVLSEVAGSLGLRTYLMTKQFARNPYVTAAGLAAGLDSTVSVDVGCALQLTRYGLPIGHLGHLTQVPHHLTDRALSWSPEVITVFNVEHARWIDDAAGRLGRTQDLLLKVYGPDDIFFQGQEGGTDEDEVLATAHRIAALPNVRVVGTTAFPCVRYEPTGTRDPELTPNFFTAVRAAEALRQDGFEITQVNAPGNTSSLTMPLLASAGATHVEPGHGLLGSTPAHAHDGTLPERPACLYVSEISHEFRGRAYAYGGGLFQDIFPEGYAARALVGRTWEEARDNAVEYHHDIPQIIDYHAVLGPAERCPVGASAIFGFRSQIQMTRSFIAPVFGVAAGEPDVPFIFDAADNALDPATLQPVPVDRVVADLSARFDPTSVHKPLPQSVPTTRAQEQS